VKAFFLSIFFWGVLTALCFGQEGVSRPSFRLGVEPQDVSKVRFSGAVREGYDSNLFTTNEDPVGSFYSNVAAGVAYDFGSPRLRGTVSLGGGVTYYYTRPGEKIDYTGELSGEFEYRISPRMTLGGFTSTAYLSQPDLFIAGTSARRDGDYFFTDTGLDLSYAWSERVSSVTGYRFSSYYYVEDALNRSQGRISQEGAQSLRFQLWPKTVIVGEYRFNPVTYYYADQNNCGNYGLLGFDHQFNPRSFWSVRAGVEQRFLNNAVDGRSLYFGPYAQSEFEYFYGPTSFVSLLMRYGTEGSGLNGVTIRETFRTGIVVNHALTSRITLGLGFAYLHNRYDQPGVILDFTENIFEVSPEVNFQVNRWLALEAGYNFTTVLSEESVREYSRNIGYVGMVFSF